MFLITGFCHIGHLHLPGILSTLRLFCREKTDPNFLADASFLRDEAPVTFTMLRNKIKHTSCAVRHTTLVISACVQSSVVDTSFKMSALNNDPGKLAYLLHNHKNCEDEGKSEFDTGSVSAFSNSFFLCSYFNKHLVRYAQDALTNAAKWSSKLSDLIQNETASTMFCRIL